MKAATIKKNVFLSPSCALFFPFFSALFFRFCFVFLLEFSFIFLFPCFKLQFTAADGLKPLLLLLPVHRPRSTKGNQGRDNRKKLRGIHFVLPPKKKLGGRL